MATAFLVSTALMGALVLLVLGWIARSRGWYQYAPNTAVVPARGSVSNGAISEDPRILAVAFALLVVGGVGGVVAYISGPVENQPLVGTGVALAAGSMLVGYLLFGVYSSATSRGHPRSLAVAESATVAGLLFLLAVTAQLVG